jgi:hypothetical protein
MDQLLGLVLRIFDLARGWRLGLSIKAMLRGAPEIGNDIVVLNASDKPVNIYYLDLAWVERRWPGWQIPGFRRFAYSVSPDEDNFCNITVPAHGQQTLSFSGEDHFDWGADLKQDIYLRLWIVGRKRPVWFWVTGPNS